MFSILSEVVFTILNVIMNPLVPWIKKQLLQRWIESCLMCQKGSCDECVRRPISHMVDFCVLSYITGIVSETELPGFWVTFLVCLTVDKRLNLRMTSNLLFSRSVEFSDHCLPSILCILFSFFFFYKGFIFLKHRSTTLL